MELRVIWRRWSGDNKPVETDAADAMTPDASEPYEVAKMLGKLAAALLEKGIITYEEAADIGNTCIEELPKDG